MGKSLLERIRASRDGVGIYLSAAGPAGLLRAVEGKLTNSVRNVSITRMGCQHPFMLRVPTSDVPTCWQVFVNREYDFEVAAQPRVIIDAGANIGLASIFFANRFPDARIIAIEPERGNFELLKANIAAYPNVIPVQAALWNRNEQIDLLDPGLGNWGFMTGDAADANQLPSASRHVVEGMTVDRIMREFDLEQIDILKIDIEGAEREVFGDTSAWIDKVDSLIVELHEHMKSGCTASFERGTAGIEARWFQGENVYLTRGRCLRPRGSD